MRDVARRISAAHLQIAYRCAKEGGSELAMRTLANETESSTGICADEPMQVMERVLQHEKHRRVPFIKNPLGEHRGGAHSRLAP